MKTEILNGKDVRSGIPQKDTVKGVAAMAKVEANKEAANPLAEKLKKANEVQKLVDKRKKLVDVQDTVNLFEEGLDGEDDLITLESGKGGKVRSLEVSKPDAVRRVVELLKADVKGALEEVESKILASTI